MTSHRWCPGVTGWSAVIYGVMTVSSGAFRCVFTFEPHQSQYLASAWFIRLHLEQDNILLSADGTEGALSLTHTTCSNTHTHPLKQSVHVMCSVRVCACVLPAAGGSRRSDSWRCELDFQFHRRHTAHDPAHQTFIRYVTTWWAEFTPINSTWNPS